MKQVIIILITLLFFTNCSTKKEGLVPLSYDTIYQQPKTENTKIITEKKISFIIEKISKNITIETSYNKYGARRSITIEYCRKKKPKTILQFQIIDWNNDGKTDYINHTETVETEITKDTKNIGFYKGYGLLNFIKLYKRQQPTKTRFNRLKRTYPKQTGIVYQNPYLFEEQNKFKFKKIKDHRLDRILFNTDKMLVHSKNKHGFKKDKIILKIILYLIKLKISKYPLLWSIK